MLLRPHTSPGFMSEQGGGVQDWATASAYPVQVSNVFLGAGYRRSILVRLSSWLLQALGRAEADGARGQCGDVCAQTPWLG